MNFIVFAGAFLLFATVMLYFFVETSKTKRLALYIAIPIFMMFSLYTYNSIQNELGYATENVEALKEDFLLISFTRGEGDELFLLVIGSGDIQPRLYKIHDPGQEVEEAIRRQQLAGIGNGQGEGQEGQEGQAGEGIPLVGRFEGGGFGTSGEWKFYPFNPQTRLKKS